MAKTLRHCSFCGRTQSEVDKLIAGPDDLLICNLCVALCADVFANEGIPPFAPEKSATSENARRKLKALKTENDGADEPMKIKSISPEYLKHFLDEHVVGQEEAKKVLSVAVHNHYKRLSSCGKIVLQETGRKPLRRPDLTEVEIEKSNILLLGPTGVGKTLLARSLAKALSVPFAIADATTLTEAGYVGEDVENIVLRLIQAADYNISRAECGIIYVDEIDKVARRTENVSITRDVSGEGVQQALLKILEGTICNVPPKGGRKHPEQDYLRVDTQNILFICGGAFVGLEKMVFARTGVKILGFDPTGRRSEHAKEDAAAAMKQVQPEDLIQFGLIPEFVGRLPIVTALDELDESDLIHVLTKPKNALLKQYQRLLAMEGVDLIVPEKVSIAIAREALKRKTGARGLRAIMEKAMLGILFDLPQLKNVRQVTLTEELILGNGEPIYSNGDKRFSA